MVFANPNVWNPNFSTELIKYIDLGFDLSKVWVKISTGFIFIIIAATMIEIITSLYKGVKYNKIRI